VASDKWLVVSGECSVPQCSVAVLSGSAQWSVPKLPVLRADC